jgi:RNA polymerase sigma-70 factor (ECF subfamily)
LKNPGAGSTADLPPIGEEEAVIERLKQGDRSAAATLFEWFADGLYRRIILPRLPNRELAEDVLKDTFRLALERIEQFHPQGKSIFFWLRRIAVNRAMDVHRARKRARGLLNQKDATIERTMSPPPPPPDHAPQQAELKIQIGQSLEMLNPRYAQALRLRLLEDRDRAECAEMMDVTVGNFDVILHRACKAFREVYPP